MTSTPSHPQAEIGHLETWHANALLENGDRLTRREFERRYEALLRGDMQTVIAVLQQGLQSPEYAGLVRRLSASAPADPNER